MERKKFPVIPHMAAKTIIINACFFSLSMTLFAGVCAPLLGSHARVVLLCWVVTRTAACERGLGVRALLLPSGKNPCVRQAAARDGDLPPLASRGAPPRRRSPPKEAPRVLRTVRPPREESNSEPVRPEDRTGQSNTTVTRPTDTGTRTQSKIITRKSSLLLEIICKERQWPTRRC